MPVVLDDHRQAGWHRRRERAIMDAVDLPHHRFLVIAARERPWWLITVPELGGIVTQAVRWADVEPMARGLVAAWLDVEIDQVSVTVRRSSVPAGPSAGPVVHVRVWAGEAARVIRGALGRAAR